MRHGLVLAGVLAVAACSNAVAPASAARAPAPAPSGRVEMAMAQRIERQVVLPAGASPVANHARFYYRGDARQGGLVIGEYFRSPDPSVPNWPRPGIYLKPPTIGVDDGGCMVVTLTYDPARDRITSIACNGVG